MDIAKNIQGIKAELPANVSLIAVSKRKPNEAILTAYNAGHKAFGENIVQDLQKKHEVLPKDIEWHFIGHLQSNKVKYIAPFVFLIHSVDSLKLLKIINKEGLKNKRIIHCLLQIHIAEEDTKFGLSPDDLAKLLQSEEYKTLENIKIKGLMGMATNTSDKIQVRAEFAALKKQFDIIKNSFFKDDADFDTLSMGMSGDYKIAVEEGSNMIRVGSSIFGERV